MNYLRHKAEAEKPEITTNSPDDQRESSLRFLMHASDLERLRIEHQLEALRE